MKVANQNLNNISKKAFFEYQKLFPVLKKEKNKQYGILALTFFTLTLFGIFALNPTITTIIELRKTLEDARSVEAQLAQKIQDMQTLRAEYDSLGMDLELIDNAIPDGPAATRFTGQLQAIAQDTGVSMRGLSVGSISIAGAVPANENPSTTSIINNAASSELGLSPYIFTVSVRGTYPQVSTFLNTLGNFDRVVDIKSISVSRETTTSSDIGMSIQGVVYFKQ